MLDDYDYHDYNDDSDDDEDDDAQLLPFHLLTITNAMTMIMIIIISVIISISIYNIDVIDNYLPSGSSAPLYRLGLPSIDFH